jgi:hypothetical protein
MRMTASAKFRRTNTMSIEEMEEKNENEALLKRVKKNRRHASGSIFAPSDGKGFRELSRGHGASVRWRNEKRRARMNKQITKQIFGVPSLETAGRIDDVDKVSAFEAAHYRCRARMSELEQQFEVKASEIRSAFVAEVAEISGAAE